MFEILDAPSGKVRDIFMCCVKQDCRRVEAAGWQLGQNMLNTVISGR